VTDLRKAIDDFEEAVRLDPAYARAYAAISTAWTNLARSSLGGAEKQQAYVRADKAAQTALAIDPDLAAAHTARGAFLDSSLQDWAGAEAEYNRALQLDPDNTLATFQYAMLRAAQGHVTQAVDMTRQLLVKDPRNGGGFNFLGKYLIALGRLDEAEQSIRKAIELRPGSPTPYMWLANIAILRNDAATALHWAEQTPEGNWRQISVALALQIGDDRAAADTALQGLIAAQADASAVQIAEIYALRNEPDKVFEWLDHAWTTHDSGIGLLLYDPFLQRFRDDPRFAAFCRKVGLPPPAPTAKGR
jgi:serine/threonine-protein kinase